MELVTIKKDNLFKETTMDKFHRMYKELGFELYVEEKKETKKETKKEQK